MVSKEISANELEQFEGKELGDAFGSSGVLVEANHGTDRNGEARHAFVAPDGKRVYRTHSEVQHSIQWGSPGSPSGEGQDFQDPSDAYEGDF